MKLRHGSLFSGIGGFDLAAEWAGWENIFHCEWNPFGQRVLKHYWPNAESFYDIRKSDFSKYEHSVDIISGGFPCQPFNTAGNPIQDCRRIGIGRGRGRRFSTIHIAVDASLHRDWFRGRHWISAINDAVNSFANSGRPQKQSERTSDIRKGGSSSESRRPAELPE